MHTSHVITHLENIRGYHSSNWQVDDNIEYERITFNNRSYVLMLISWNWYRLFRITDQVEVIDIPFKKLPTGMFHVNLKSSDETTVFADRNQNNLPDFTLYFNNGGNCCPDFMAVLEINENGEVVDITPDVYDVWTNHFEDINGDGLLEIEALSLVNVLGLTGGFRPAIHRWYGWNGVAYEDISASVPEFYQPAIDDFLVRFQTATGCYNSSRHFQEPDFSFYQLLLNYYAMGRLQEGWDMMYEVLWGNCTEEELQRTQPLMDVLEDFVNHPEGFIYDRWYYPE